MTEEIASLPEDVSSIVNRLVENENASFPFLVTVVELQGHNRATTLGICGMLT